MNNAIRRVPTAKLLFVLFIAIFVPIAVFAHDPGLSAAVLKLDGTCVQAGLTFSRFDIQMLVPLDDDGDGKVSAAEFAQHQSALQTLAGDAIAVSVAGNIIRPDRVTATLDNTDGVQFDYSFALPAGASFSFESKLILRLARGHRQYLELLNGMGKRIDSRLLEARANRYESQLNVLTDTAARPHTFGQFFMLGIEHILTGFDHLAFLLALLLLGGGLREAAKIITSFTIAHSITLGLATFNLVNLPPSIVEPMIAASIVYVGMENVLRRNIKKRWLLTFAFGLIHGFGFATALRELGIGQQGGGAMVPLLSFNLGVELGQVAIATVILPLIWKLREQPKFVLRYVPACSVLVALAGGYWLIERTLLK